MMGRINGINKGKAGEREAAEWLRKKLNLDIAPQRNLEQTRSGGYDLIGLEPFIFEVKRQETLHLHDWWMQVKRAASATGDIPIVMYRQNRKPWNFLISAKYIGVDAGYLIVNEVVFIKWFNKALDNTY
jgi:hypothetical protein